ncbi:VCBS repeat-containing protein [Algoriphagus aestuarii]|nr:VCBS repeat-containing protein [Algoriphagus aestuarii]
MIHIRFIANGILVVLISCNPISERKQPPPSLNQLAAADLNLNGEQLANAYCAACHVKPEPEILDQMTWKEKVLPDMRKRMGLFLDEDFGTTMPIDMDVPKGIYSEFPLIKRKDWEKLQSYYIDNAPSQPNPQVSKANIELGIPGFELIRPEFTETYADLVTMLRIHPKTGDLWLGHRYKSLFVLDPASEFRIKDSIGTETAPIDIHWDGSGGFDLLTMGLMDPSNDSVGVLSNYKKSESGWESRPMFQHLKRPVNNESADFNGDGDPDQIISEFGNHIGELSLYLTGSNGFEKMVLKNAPGARRVEIDDLDGDGDMDILALMTQANEGFFAFMNDGQGNFKEKIILRFQPAFGSSDFRMVDMNADGRKDLVVVNGDNADLSQILKNYHGVRVFINQGDFEFEEGWFYPMHGASALEVGDFDQDGDQDLFVLSFFPDESQKPKQDLLFFRQNGTLQFTPFAPKIDFGSHWLMMTKGDLELDGDEDLVVGVFEFDDLYSKPTAAWSPILVLKNTLK